MSLHLETHKYDGTIGQIYHQLPTHTSTLSFEQSIALIEQWLATSAITDQHHINRAIDLIKHDRAGNYDPINRINVEDLLPKVVEIVRHFESSGIDLFLQNLGEISELGSCPQGRITRLLSFYIPYVT